MNLNRENDTSTIISLETVLNEGGDFFAEAIKHAAEECYNTAAILSKRNEISVSAIEQNTSQIPGLLKESTDLRNDLRRVDDSIRKQKRQSHLLKELSKLIEEIETQRECGNESKCKELERKKQILHPHVKQELMLMSVDIKESLKLRFYLLRTQRKMISLDVNLNSAYVFSLVSTLTNIAESITDETIRTLIKECIRGVPVMEPYDIELSSPPDDPAAFQELIDQELRELKKIEAYRNQLVDQTKSMQNIEYLLEEEIDRTGFPRLTPKSFTEEDDLPMSRILAEMDFEVMSKPSAASKSEEEAQTSKKRMAYQQKRR
ncbi:MAG: hypothetical protein C4527_06895 [Candidatus Omnitrophota bacterium]|jgi:hypothetical protein|nr:MAG: hypothetical protein C4527_06895 [Candidatus Omnitrophota bacterium]